MSLLEEFDRQHGGQAPEDIEVIPFDDVSHRRGDDHGPEILWDFDSHIRFLRIAVIASRHADAPEAPQGAQRCAGDVGKREVQLHDLVSGARAGVGHIDSDIERITRIDGDLPQRQIAIVELGVAETVSERPEWLASEVAVSAPLDRVVLEGG